MLKYKPQFHVWAFGPLSYLIICSCAKTFEVLVLTWDANTGIQEMSDGCKFPDLRSLQPVAWDQLPGQKRAGLRHVFQKYLEGKHGIEVIHNPAWSEVSL